jgi:HD-like signal output (HDOD) protein
MTMQADLAELSREAEDVVKNICLPPCPTILAALVREMRNDDPDIGKLNQLISSDVTIAAALLKTVNSPFYGLRSKMASIRHALTLVGLRAVTQLVTGLLLRQAFPAGGGAHLEEFWERSSGTARATACLARKVKGVDAEDAYTFALFRDCGVPAMMAAFRDYRPAQNAPAAGQKVTEVESARYGMNHALLGSSLAKSWLLPEAIWQAVMWHHDHGALAAGSANIPPTSVRLIALALAGEHLFSRHARSVKCPEWEEHGAFALAQLGLAETDFEDMASAVAAALNGK